MDGVRARIALGGIDWKTSLAKDELYRVGNRRHYPCGLVSVLGTALCCFGILGSILLRNSIDSFIV